MKQNKKILLVICILLILMSANIGMAVERRITTNTADQFAPAIYGNNIVYANRSGNLDIYICTIFLQTWKEELLQIRQVNMLLQYMETI